MNPILEKVKKLLALAGNAGATEGERDNALRMAHGLLAKHNLDMADLVSKKVVRITLALITGWVGASMSPTQWPSCSSASIIIMDTR